MAINLPGPYQIEYSYTVTIGGLALQHFLRLNVIGVGTITPGDLPTTIFLQTRSGTPMQLDLAANQAWEFLRGLVPTVVPAGVANFWKFAPGTEDRTYVCSVALTNPTGAAVGAPVDSHYMNMTFRTAAGGTLKILILEDANATSLKLPITPLVGGDAYEELAAYIVSADNVAIGRDDAFPIAPNTLNFGQNEQTWKARHRP